MVLYMLTYLKVCAVTSVSERLCIWDRTASHPLAVVFMDKDSFAPRSSFPVVLSLSDFLCGERGRLELQPGLPPEPLACALGASLP